LEVTIGYRLGCILAPQFPFSAGASTGTTKTEPVHEVLDRGAQAASRGEARCASQELDRGAQAVSRGTAHVRDRGVQAVARGTARWASQVLDRGAQADARGAGQVLDRGAKAAARGAARSASQVLDRVPRPLPGAQRRCCSRKRTTRQMCSRAE